MRMPQSVRLHTGHTVGLAHKHLTITEPDRHVNMLWWKATWHNTRTRSENARNTLTHAKHRDKPRVCTPEKMFPHLKLIYFIISV
jgi:hypothetical protein